MRIAVTGYTGRLGGYLWREMGCDPLICDITVPESVYQAISNIRPDVVIHCAAYTNVDRSEQEPDVVMETNVDGTRNLRTVFDGKIIHISTDYIFDGVKGPYSEKSPPNPISTYGLSKYRAENIIFDGRKDDVIVRTTVLYGNTEKDDFVSRMLNSLSVKGIPVRVTKSIFGTPTYIPHLAKALVQLAEMDTRFIPVVNIAGREVLSRYEFALMIAKVFSFDREMVKYTTKVPGIAPRPRKAGLKTDYAEGIGLPIYSVHEGLEDLYCALEYV